MVLVPHPRSWYPRLSTPVEAARILTGTYGEDIWPPPGTHVVPVGHPESWGLVVEDSYGSAAVSEEPYWTSLSEFLVDLPARATEIMARLASSFVGPIAQVVGAIGNWPVVWSSTEGQTMRWISVTLRGSLGGGVEQFQHKVDLGNPGNDPTITEAQALALAEQLTAVWAASWITSVPAGGSLQSLFPPTVRYEEIGVVQKVQTDGTGSDGSGGNLEQSFPTQWFAYPTASRPVGNTNGTLPYEVACAVSMHTDHRGPSGRGRLYLPCFTPSAVGTDGLFTVAVSNIACQGIADFLRDISAATPYEPVVVSRRRIILNQVKSLTVGRVPDAQRRRRRSQDEAPVQTIL